jgi:hypothetical protein
MSSLLVCSPAKNSFEVACAFGDMPNELLVSFSLNDRLYSHKMLNKINEKNELSTFDKL